MRVGVVCEVHTSLGANAVRVSLLIIIDLHHHTVV